MSRGEKIKTSVYSCTPPLTVTSSCGFYDYIGDLLELKCSDEGVR